MANAHGSTNSETQGLWHRICSGPRENDASVPTAPQFGWPNDAPLSSPVRLGSREEIALAAAAVVVIARFCRQRICQPSAAI